ncbi:FtsB family cell division protein [Thiomicrorhabdus sediminis]|uniref:Cell division protein FtsB n=1 Tax=Thiomicrorhabdus sediminis TaxID=2580412 RepID=A0A4P9K5C4_9GAMM|nr:septum formation initiator family protein [Thiomicrorhabdus sediminis]QCU90169.1 septum formation initiator family protein [Thiomicrorhabdus sediminis]
MKKIYLALALLIVVLQARLLSSDGGLSELFTLQNQLTELESSLTEQRLQNAKLAEEVHELQNNPQAIETIARQTLGMVKKDEVFVNVITLKQPDPNTDESVMDDSATNSIATP